LVSKYGVDNISKRDIKQKENSNLKHIW
jgi:hypothetical protein